MNLIEKLRSRLGWLNLPVVTLIALLQRSPATSVIVAVDEWVTSAPMGAILKSSIATLVSLGAVHSLAGATTLASSTASPLNVTTGKAITPVTFTVTNTVNIASWKITGALPPGISITAIEGGNTLTGPGTLAGTTTSTPKLSGIPTAAGSYTFGLQAFENPNATGLASNVFPYTVVVAGAANTGTAPSFTTQPISVTIVSGTTVVFTATATGSPAVTYQWTKGGAAISGATKSTLLINAATSANAGSYTCVATNTAGNATSSAAALTLTNTTDVGRLINLSTRAQVGTGGNILIVGFVLGGAGTSGTKPMLIRGIGPTLATSFTVPDVLVDPTLTFFAGNIVVNSNDNWAGNSQITALDSAVGAFPFPIPTSLDSALTATLGVSSYSAQIAGNNNGTGVALAEVYDASTSFNPAAPRLINLSARVQVGTGGNILIAGFVIGGSSAKTVLVRASGPALVPFGVPGTLPDPALTLFNSSGSSIASNAGWSGDPQITSTAASVGAFPWNDPSSKDAALLITLPPGAYSAQVSGASGDTGVALVEVYEVP